MRDTRLARLLEHPAIWRGRSAAARSTWPSGFAALDEQLPGRGWPRSGLVEILVPRFGSGELRLMLPVLARLSRAAAARWCVWVTPPLVPFAPALAAGGVQLARIAVVDADPARWAFEQALRSGACDAVLAWVRQPRSREIRRLQLAAERGRTLGILFRPLHAAQEASAAILRLSLTPCRAGARITLLKGRTAHRGSIEIGLDTCASSS
ncbi:MAG: translesion DNA synthesis-associated protein ImuA [Proteobacteria bacterium]|nr:translesion DNA synthesis-associated protein ImuA [Pseudomonadota bacterium]